MNEHKNARLLQKVTRNTLEALVILYDAKVKEYVEVKEDDTRSYYELDARTIHVSSNTPKSTGMHKLVGMCDKTLKDETAEQNTYTLTFKPEIQGVFRLIGMGDVVKMWEQNKDLAYRLYESKLSSLIKSLNNA